jgi:hypothetical protein
MISANPPADFEPVDSGKHEVEHDQVRRRLANCAESRRPVGYRDDGVAGPLEVADHDLRNHGVVIDHEDARHDHEV